MRHGRHAPSTSFAGQARRFALAWLPFLLAGCAIEPRIHRVPACLRPWRNACTVPASSVVPVCLEQAPRAADSIGRDQDALPLLALAESRLSQADRYAAHPHGSAESALLYRQALGPALRVLNRFDPTCYQPLAAPCSTIDPRDLLVLQQAAWLHDRALAGLLLAVGCRPGGNGPTQVAGSLAQLGVAIGPADPVLADIGWDELWLTSDFVASQVKDPCRWPGLGVPLIAYRGKRERLGPPETCYPPRWKFAVTAVARPLDPSGPVDGPIEVQVLDPRAVAQVVTNRVAWPLAADLSTPIIHLLSGSRYRNKGLAGLFLPEQFTDEEGIALIHPYQPGRIPVILIHGMGCSPRIMADIACTITADPVLRARYQVFVAYYTSGDTILQDATKLRTAIRDCRAHFDPAQQDPAWDQTVVLGHSLGGPIARLLTSSSGDEMEHTIFTVPFEEVRLPDSTRERVSRSIYFEPVPEIKRVIYLCGTMRGSRLADGVEARIIGRLIPRRSTLEEFHAEVLRYNGAEVLNPRYRSHAPSSVENQSPESPLLAALNRLPQNETVTAHSIQADATPFLPDEHSTDLLVSLRSSTIDNALSAIVVRWSQHFCTHNRTVLDEIQRILHEHIHTLPMP